MLRGSFVERSDDRHVGLRQSMLSGRGPARTARPGRAFAFDKHDDGNAAIAPVLEKDGWALVALDAPMDGDAFLAFGQLFGTPVPERDGVAQFFSINGAVLNLVSLYGHTDDPRRQPFAATELSLHSESSGAALADQCRYIVLMCCDPGDSFALARTLLVAMGEVVEALAPQYRTILSLTRYRGATGMPPILRADDGRPVLSFRDFQGQPLEWEADLPAGEEQAVEQAFRSLLVAMYDAEPWCVDWTSGSLLVIDNRRVFHGRTRAAPGQRPRHLKRLRLI